MAYNPNGNSLVGTLAPGQMGSPGGAGGGSLGQAQTPQAPGVGQIGNIAGLLAKLIGAQHQQSLQNQGNLLQNEGINQGLLAMHQNSENQMAQQYGIPQQFGGYKAATPPPQPGAPTPYQQTGQQDEE